VQQPPAHYTTYTQPQQQPHQQQRQKQPTLEELMKSAKEIDDIYDFAQPLPSVKPQPPVAVTPAPPKPMPTPAVAGTSKIIPLGEPPSTEGDEDAFEDDTAKYTTSDGESLETPGIPIV
jgi:hypothetical protein